MDQYRLWLQYREVDRQLHTRLKQLEDEFVQLQLRLDALNVANESHEATDNNLIIQALAYSMQRQQPTFMPHVVSEPPPLMRNNGPYTFHPELMPLPQDITSSQSESVLGMLPQTPPWWSDTQPMTPSVEPTHGLVDQQSARTNRLVQRWVERWGRHLSEIRAEAEERS